MREPLDADPPGLTLTAKKVQAGKPVKVKVSCDEACSVSVSGTAKPRGGKKGQLGSASAQLAAGETAQVVLKAKGRLKRKLRRAGRGKAQLAATATDPAGNSAAAVEKVKLK